MTSDPTDDGTSFGTRRSFLALGIAGLASVAGCSSSGDTESPTPDDPAGETDESTSTGTVSTAVGRSLEEWPGYDPDWAAPTSAPAESDLEVEVLVENLEIPWDMSFAPDGTLFLTERVGRVVEFADGEIQRVASPADAIDAGSLEPGADEQPWYVDGGEGGTLGIAVHPSFPEPAEVFVYYTTAVADGVVNRVDAFDVRSNDPATPVRTVVDDIPADNYHNGGRITFGPQNYLWITCGDALEGGRAQDLNSLGGKFLRVTPEGDPAPDNPDLGADADPRIFSYGHRNPQGVVWLPDGTAVGTEHGPNGRDEINRLVAGENYGWDAEGERIRQREEYPGSGVHKPLYNTGGESLAPSGSVFYTGSAVPSLRNRLLTGGLISQSLVVTTLTPPGGQLPPAGGAYDQVGGADWSDDAFRATVHRLFEDELGRIRHVEQGPDGNVYVCTSNRDGRPAEDSKFPTKRDDVLARIRPAD
ncbi:glucose dehydrogenase [Halobacteriales archaeon QH_10_67_22]|nr:MAG: glucose dehydrogenase [Halobacteriales archaeon QH_10_67_22]